MTFTQDLPGGGQFVTIFDVDQLVETARADCYCSRYRKPCEYHQGWRDGAETVYAGIRALLGAEFE